MQVKVLFFGPLAEMMSSEIMMDQVKDTGALIDQLKEETAGQTRLISLNQKNFHRKSSGLFIITKNIMLVRVEKFIQSQRG